VVAARRALPSAGIFGPMLIFWHSPCICIPQFSDVDNVWHCSELSPYLTRWHQAEPYPSCRHDVFEETVLSNPYPALFDEVFSWPTTSSDLKGDSEKSVHNSGNWELPSSEKLTISMETVTKVVNHQSYFTTGGLPPISSSWHWTPWESRPEIFFKWTLTVIVLV
jgi:hypothetical protein